MDALAEAAPYPHLVTILLDHVAAHLALPRELCNTCVQAPPSVLPESRGWGRWVSFTALWVILVYSQS